MSNTIVRPSSIPSAAFSFRDHSSLDKHIVNISLKIVQSSTLRRNILETFSEIGALCNNGREFNTDLLVRSLFRIATPSADEIEISAKKIEDSPRQSWLRGLCKPLNGGQKWLPRV